MINELVSYHQQLTTEQATLEEKLKDIDKRLTQLEQSTLPDVMAMLGVDELSMPALGVKLKVVEQVTASVTQARAQDVYAWLKARNMHAIAKGRVMFSDVTVAEEIAREQQAEFKIDIHPSTLAAFVKEQLAQEREEEKRRGQSLPEVDKLPRKLFGVFTLNRVTIKDRK